MRIGIYCTNENFDTVIDLFKILFPKHDVSISGDITKHSFITTIAYKIIMLSETHESCEKYDIMTIEEFFEKYPYKKGDIVRWYNWDDKYEIVDICGKGQKITYKIVGDALDCVWAEAKDITYYYQKRSSELTNKGRVLKAFKNIINLCEEKKYYGNDWSELSDREVLDWVKEISEDAMEYIEKYVEDKI